MTATSDGLPARSQGGVASAEAGERLARVETMVEAIAEDIRRLERVIEAQAASIATLTALANQGRGGLKTLWALGALIGLACSIIGTVAGWLARGLG
ncbi:MAG: hypothetical protein ACREER_09950 [Alphaproteobacteria bacterium]